MLGLVDPLSDFYDAVHHSERFVLHVLTSAQARLAESFAFRIPGDPFDGEPVSTSAWGPVLGSVPTRAGCRLVASSEAGYSRLLRARIEEIVLDERAARPLVHYRGGYVSVGPRQD